jgi:MraZ protein
VFRGTFQHAIDAKGRTSLPAKFREVLAGRSEEQLVVTQGPDKCLWCLPLTVWAGFEAKVRAMPQFKPEVRSFMHAFVAPAQDCPFDKMGRILVPPTLREYAGLDGEVVWAGAIDRIELWSAAKWKKRAEETTAALDGGVFSETLGNLGL